jgi:hypothetical protein
MKKKKRTPVIIIISIIFGIVFAASIILFIYNTFFAYRFTPKTTQQLNSEDIYMNLPTNAKKDFTANPYTAFIALGGNMQIEIRETAQEDGYQSGEDYRVVDSFGMATSTGSKKLYLLSSVNDNSSTTSLDLSECSNKICDIKSAKTGKFYSVHIWKQRGNYSCCSNPADYFSPNDAEVKNAISAVETIRID